MTDTKSPLLDPTEIDKTHPDYTRLMKVYQCKECMEWGPAHFFLFSDLENIIAWFPEKRLIHIHFGKPSWNEEITHNEAQWVYDVTEACISKDTHPLFCTADFSRIDDSEFPTKDSIRIYGEAVGRVGTAHVVSYGQSSAMLMIMKLIATVSTTARKVSFAPTHDDAMKQYEEWFVEQKNNNA